MSHAASTAWTVVLVGGGRGTDNLDAEPGVMGPGEPTERLSIAGCYQVVFMVQLQS